MEISQNSLSDNEVGLLGVFETGTNSCSLSSSFCLLAIHLLLDLSVFRVSADRTLTSVVVRRLSASGLSSFLIPLEFSVSSNMTLFISVAAFCTDLLSGSVCTRFFGC